MFGRQAAAGLRAWAAARGARLRIEDDRSLPAESARLATALAGSCDLLLGPYGSGCGREVAAAMAGRREVVWNHGAAAVPRTGARMADVLGPAGRYWAGLPAVLGGPSSGARVAIVRAPGGFAAEIAAGAHRALGDAGLTPAGVWDLDPRAAGDAVVRALAAGAGWIAGGGRLEDDLALARAASEAGVPVALVACGVSAVADELGDRVAGWLGPVQWDGTPPPAPFSLPPGSDYPAAQALATALVAEEALATAGSSDPDALWGAARALRTRTLIGPFAIDPEGRQTAHAPCIVRWRAAPGGPERVVVWRPPAAGA